MMKNYNLLSHSTAPLQKKKKRPKEKRKKTKLLFMMKTTPQRILHMLIIQVILVHCASFEAKNLQMQQQLQQNGKAT